MDIRSGKYFVNRTKNPIHKHTHNRNQNQGMKKAKIIYCCQECGYNAPKWLGRCPECGGWDSFVEERKASSNSAGARTGQPFAKPEPVPIDSVDIHEEDRTRTGIHEFDRVLGGGVVAGSLVLIGGDPGIGKSTLLLQVIHGLAMQDKKILYVSGEESVRQIKMRSRRLEAISPGMLVVSEIDIDAILEMTESVRPDALVVDSIQTMFSPESTSAPGSVSQVREATMKLMVMAKRTGIPTFLIGHVTKDGAIAGPRIMEHMVDTVLYFEGDQNHEFRILRAVKNRFGSTNEIGVFEMKEKGLAEVRNPSAIFLAERAANTPGSVVTACIEGTRPILVELQALISSAGFGTPRRTVLGLDYNRVSLLVAVMEKKLGLNLAGHDIFMNVTGGVKVSEPAVDLGIVAAVASSFLDRPVPEGLVPIGEVGLSGEVRGVSHLETRISEIRKMGFTTCIVPKNSLKQLTNKNDLRLIGVTKLSEVLDNLF
jgi:DNA repair protein RadA/Sms